MEYDLDELTPQFRIGSTVHENKIEDDIKINKNDLEYEFLDHSRRYLYYAWLSEQAKSALAEATIHEKVIYAQQDQKARDEGNEIAKQVKGFRMTEKMVENQAFTSDEHMEALRALNEAKLVCGLLEQSKQALIQRRDMLLQLGANYRTEGTADPVILKEVARERAKERALEKSEPSVTQIREKLRREQIREKSQIKYNTNLPPPRQPGKVGKTIID